MTYIIWLSLFVGAPLLALAALARRWLWRQWRTLGWMLAGALAGGWAWDVLAVRLGAWYYDPRNIVNIWIGGLPLEEWLWIVGVSLLFGCVTIVIETHSQQNHATVEPQNQPKEHQSVGWGCFVFGSWLLFDVGFANLGRFSHLAMLLGAGVVFHAMLWARNARFLWSRRGTITAVIALALCWQFITDPIGGWWGAWFFDPHKVIGVWFFGVMPLEDLFGITIVSSASACAVLVFGYGPRSWI